MLLRSLVALAIGVLASHARAAEPPTGFAALFNGTDLTGWQGWAIHAKGASPADLAKLSTEEREKLLAAWNDDAKKHWSVQGGELVNDGQGAYLATDKDYGDIELLIEYKTVAEADSGIYLRNTPQVQIWDSTRRSTEESDAAAAQGLRRAVQQRPRLARPRPARPGRQAVRRVEQLPHPPGRRADHRLSQRQAGRRSRPDGELLGQTREARPLPPIPPRGRSCLQTHGGEIRWRNLFVREIPAGRGQRSCCERMRPASRTSSTARTSTAGTARSGKYEIIDGAIVCKPEKGGNIYTKAEYADFTVRLEYKLPAGGNNGLAIRYPAARLTSPRRPCAKCRSSTTKRRSTPSSTRGSTTARPTAWSPPIAATCGPSANGTSWR